MSDIDKSTKSAKSAIVTSSVTADVMERIEDVRWGLRETRPEFIRRAIEMRLEALEAEVAIKTS